MSLDGRTVGQAVVLLRWIADKLPPDQKDYAAMLSQLAGALVNGGPGAGCEKCGTPIPVNRTGRPRKYCTTCAPRKTPRKVHTEERR